MRKVMKRASFFIVCTALCWWLLLAVPAVEAAIAEYLKENITPALVIHQFNNQLPLGQPVDVYIDGSGNLYVIDSSSKAVLIFDNQYQPLSRLDAVSGLSLPKAVAADQKGYIYVSDAEGGILVFNSIGKIVRKIDLEHLTKGKVRSAQDLAIDQSGYLYLATGTEQGALVIDPQGRLKMAITPQEPPREEGMGPTPVAVDRLTLDSDGRIYLLSAQIGRIYVYQSPDRFLFQFGQKGGSFGKLSQPVGIAVDRSKGLIYVIDYMRHTLSIYNLEGVFLQEYGGQGEKPGWFSHPNQICLDKEHRLIVADSFNHRLQVLAVQSP